MHKYGIVSSSKGAPIFPMWEFSCSDCQSTGRPGSGWVMFDNSDKCRVFMMPALPHRFLQRFFDLEKLK